MMKIILIFSFLVSLVISIIVVEIALEHNPMRKFCLNPDALKCDIDWLSLLPIGLFWFAMAFIICMSLLSIIFFLIKTR